MLLPAETSIGHVQLTVHDRMREAEFYREILGFRVAQEDDATTFLSSTGRYPFHILLSEDAAAEPRPRRSAGLYHLAILVPSRAALAQVLRRLLDSAWPLQGASDHGVSEAVYLQDPEGNGIEIYADRPRARWPRPPAGGGSGRSDQIVMPTRPLDLEDLLADATGGPWSGLLPQTAIGHVHLRVTDLTREEAFYSGIIGLEVMVRTYPGALFLAAGGYHHHLGLNTWAGANLPAPVHALGLRAFAIRLPDRAQLAAAVARIQAAGLPLSAVDHGVCLAAYVYDPDEITLALTVDVAGQTRWQEHPLSPEALR